MAASDEEVGMTTMKWAGRAFGAGFAVAAVCAYVTGAADATIYWANISGNTISASNNNGKDVNQNFITGADGPSDVIVSADHIYWGNATGGCTESGSCPGSIAVANLNGSDIRENLIHADTPYGLAIDGHYIYWSNFGSNTIGRANLDGSDVDQDFIAGASSPDGVVVNGQYIYWSNNGATTIGRANLNGTDADQSFISGASGPEGMAINGQYIYWVNHNNGTIGRATLAGAGVTQNFITGADSYPTRVTVTSTHIYWTTWTTNGVPTSGTIGVANLNGTGVDNHLIHGNNSPVGVAVTSGSVPARCVVPDVVGKKLSAAEKALRKAHCGVGRVRRSRSFYVPKGRVITQSLMTGDSFTPGSKVGLVVSTG
jgi:hypothetical protein